MMLLQDLMIILRRPGDVPTFFITEVSQLRNRIRRLERNLWSSNLNSSGPWRDAFSTIQSEFNVV